METFIIVLVYVVAILGFGFDTWLSWLNYQNRNKEIPKEVNDIYDEKDYKKWLEYTMENFRFSKIISTINTLLFLVFLTFGVYGLFDEWAKALFENTRLQILAFVGIDYVIGFVIGLYPSYYNTFTIEEKYGFNKATKKTFITDNIKSVILTVIFGGGLVFLLVVISDNAGRLFFLYAWGAVFLILLVVNTIYTSVIVPLFNKLTPLEDGELKDAINDFAHSVGYEVSKISVMDASKRSSRLNAFFSGFGKFKKIVLYDTLIEKMSTEEIVAVLAHEIGHNKHKHIIHNMVIMGITMLIYISLFGFMIQSDVFSTAFGFESANFGFSMILFFILFSPVATLVGAVTAQISRRAEYQADAFAATKYKKEPMISALKVLAKENFANLTPHPLYVKLTYSHPPIADRINAINKL